MTTQDNNIVNESAGTKSKLISQKDKSLSSTILTAEIRICSMVIYIICKIIKNIQIGHSPCQIIRQ